MNQRHLDGLTAFITGCNRGIGRAILEAFAREGCNIIACTRAERPEFTELIERLAADNGVTIRPLYFNLESEDEIKQGIKELYAMKSPVDILVNNAGIVNTDGLMRLRMAEARRVMQVNYFAQVQITQGMLKLLMRSKHASIINICSITAFTPTVGNTVYGSSKAAMICATKCWAKELGPAGIRVNGIAPGYIATEMTTGIPDQDLISALIQDTALKRLGTPEEVAEGAVFLASDSARFVDGHILTIGGGYRL